MIEISAKSFPSTATRTRRTRTSGNVEKIPSTEKPSNNDNVEPQSPQDVPKQREDTHTTANGQSSARDRAKSKDSEHTPLTALPPIGQFKRVLSNPSTVQLDADKMDSVLREIIEHCERIDGYQKLGKNVDTDGLPTMGAEPGLKARALPVLAKITTQILHIFATYEYLDLVTIVAEPESEAGKVIISIAS